MLNKIFLIYRFLFVRCIFYRFHKLLFNLALRGLGFLNYENEGVSGEEAFLRTYFSTKKGATVLDVGGNVGDYAKKIIQIEPSTTIYSFEPHPKTYLQLKTASEEYGFKALNLGCGSKNDLLKLYDYIDQDGSKHASLYQEVIENIHKGTAINYVVNIVKLDDFVLQYKLNAIDLLKIDTEGNELDILKGLEGFIKKRKVIAIHFEFNEMNVVSRVFFKDFYELLCEYDLYRMLPDGLIPIKSYSPLFCEIFAYQNIVALLRPKGI